MKIETGIASSLSADALNMKHAADIEQNQR
jgi:hypothetical protein